MASILYVEDEPFLAKIVKETLEGNGYMVTLVTDGGEAINTFKSSAFDICILDIMLPNKNGYEIAQEIRISSTGVPILFLTAKDQTKDLLKGFEVGGNEYIRKPFSMEELMARIENLLSLTQVKQKNSKLSSIISISSIYTFYPQKLELHSEGLVKSLSHRESQIIELLCLNKNEVTQRKQILLKVWGDDSFYNSRNLDVYITKIRGYLKQDPRIKITTLKGVGYQFVVPDN